MATSPETTDATSTREARPRRKWGRRLLIVVVLLLCLLAATPTLVSMFGKGYVTDLVGENVNGDVQVGNLSIGWFSGTSLEDVTVKVDGADKPNLEVKTIRVDQGLWDLAFSGSIEAEIAVADVIIRIKRENGVLDVAEAAKKKEPEPEERSSDATELPELDVHVTIKNVTVIYEDDILAEPVRLDAISKIVGHVKSGEAATVSFDHPDLAGSATLHLFDGRKLRATDAMKIVARMDAKELDLAGYAPLARKWVEGLGGTLTIGQDLTFENGELMATGTLGASGLTAKLHDGSSWSVQTLDVSNDVRAPEDGPAGRVMLELGGGRGSGLTGIEGELPIATATADLRLTGDGGANWKDLLADVAGTRVSSSGAYGRDGAVDGSLDLRGDIARLAKIIGGLPNLEGRLTSKMRVRRDAEGLIKIDGSTNLDDLVATGLPGDAPDIREKSVVIDHDLDLGDGVITARKTWVRSSFLSASAQGSLKRVPETNRADGTVTMQIDANLERIAALLGDRVPVGLRGRLSGGGQIKGAGDVFNIDLAFSGTGLVATDGPFEGGPLDLGNPKMTAKGAVGVELEDFDLPTLTLTSATASMNLVAKRAAGRFDLRGHTDLDLDAILGSLGIELPGAPPGKMAADVTLSMEGEELTLTEAVARLAGNTVAKANGTVRLPGSGAEGRVHYDLSGDLGRIAAFAGDLPIGITGSGTAKGFVDLGSSTRVTSQVRAANASLTGEWFADGKMSSPQLALDLDATKGETAMAIKRLGLSMSKLTMTLVRPITITGVGTDDLRAVAPGFTGSVQLAALAPGMLGLGDDGKAYGRVKLSGHGTYGKTPFGKVSATANYVALKRGEVEIKGPLALSGDVDKAGKFVVTLDGKKLKLVRVGQKPGDLPVMSTIEGRREGEVWNFATIAVDGGGIDVDGSGRYGPDASRVKLDGKLDLGGVTQTWFALFAPDMKGQGKGIVSVTCDLPDGETPLLRRAQASVKASCDRLVLPSGFDLRQVVVDAGLAQGQGSIKDGRGTLNGGSVKLEGTLDARGEKPKWDGSIVATNVEIREEMRPAIARTVPLFAGLGVTVKARLGSDLSLAGVGEEKPDIMRTLTGLGKFDIGAGSIVGSPILSTVSQLVGIPGDLQFQPMKTQFQVNDGQVHQKGMTLVSQFADFRMSGTTALDGTLDWKIGVRVNQGGAKWQRFTKFLGSDGFLPIRLVGNLDAPSVKPPDVADLATKGLGSLIGDLLNGKKGEKKKNPFGELFGGKGLGGLLPGKKKN